MNKLVKIVVIYFAIVHVNGIYCKDDEPPKTGKLNEFPTTKDFPLEIEIENTLNGTCECLVFDTLHPEEGALPIIVQKPLNVTCTLLGEERCLQLCTALALAAKDRGPSLLCAHVINAHKLLASVFSTTCNSKKYVYTGLTSEEQVCCHEGKPLSCTDEAEVL